MGLGLWDYRKFMEIRQRLARAIETTYRLERTEQYTSQLCNDGFEASQVTMTDLQTVLAALAKAKKDKTDVDSSKLGETALASTKLVTDRMDTSRENLSLAATDSAYASPNFSEFQRDLSDLVLAVGEDSSLRPLLAKASGQAQEAYLYHQESGHAGGWASYRAGRTQDMLKDTVPVMEVVADDDDDGKKVSIEALAAEKSVLYAREEAIRLLENSKLSSDDGKNALARLQGCRQTLEEALQNFDAAQSWDGLGDVIEGDKG